MAHPTRADDADLQRIHVLSVLLGSPFWPLHRYYVIL
jgi:hypothetical protein